MLEAQFNQFREVTNMIPINHIADPNKKVYNSIMTGLNEAVKCPCTFCKGIPISGRTSCTSFCDKYLAWINKTPPP